jgi:hypothetical protein
MCIILLSSGTKQPTKKNSTFVVFGTLSLHSFLLIFSFSFLISLCATRLQKYIAKYSSVCSIYCISWRKKNQKHCSNAFATNHSLSFDAFTQILYIISHPPTIHTFQCNTKDTKKRKQRHYDSAIPLKNRLSRKKTQKTIHQITHKTHPISIIQHKRHSRSVLGKIYLLGMLLNYIFSSYPLLLFFSDFTLCNPFLKRFYNRWFKLNIYTQIHTKKFAFRPKKISLSLPHSLSLLSFIIYLFQTSVISSTTYSTRWLAKLSSLHIYYLFSTVSDVQSFLHKKHKLHKPHKHNTHKIFVRIYFSC